MNTKNAYQNRKRKITAAPATSGQVGPKSPAFRTVERKIGRATVIVYSRFSEGREKDLVSTIARLIRHDLEHMKTSEQSSFYPQRKDDNAAKERYNVDTILTAVGKRG